MRQIRSLFADKIQTTYDESFETNAGSKHSRPSFFVFPLPPLTKFLAQSPLPFILSPENHHANTIYRLVSKSNALRSTPAALSGKKLCGFLCPLLIGNVCLLVNRAVVELKGSWSVEKRNKKKKEKNIRCGNARDSIVSL